MSKTHLNLSIPTPCHENWGSMLPNEKGRHCLSCQKTVVDFTKMTDTQIIHFFQEYKTATCGRFLETQLNRPILQPIITKSQSRFAWLLSALLLPLSSNAQTPQHHDTLSLIENHETVIAENGEKAPAKVKSSKSKKKHQAEITNYNVQACAVGMMQNESELTTFKSYEGIAVNNLFILNGDVNAQYESQLPQPQPFIFKSTEEIYRDIFNSIKNWVMGTITFLKNIINS